MISKTFPTGKTFGQCVQYVCEDLNRAEILEVKGVRKHDLGLMEQDFETQRALANQVKESPVFHTVLSFPHGEHPDDRKLVALGERFMQEMRMADTQCIIVKHTDKDHLHLHILANRVSNSGAIVDGGWDILRGIKVARKLTEEFGLQPDRGKDLQQTNRQALPEPDAKRYQLYDAIREVLPGCRQLDELEKRLLERGISTRYRIDRESGERQGISFRIENYSFKGSRVDPAYSLKGLGQILELQQKQAIEEAQKQAIEEAQKQAIEKAQTLTQAQTPGETTQRKQVPEQAEAELQGQRQEKKQELRQGPRLHL